MPKTWSPLNGLQISNKCRVMFDDADAASRLNRSLASLLANHGPKPSKPLAVCIGTDRSTGDSLGPLVGYHLKRMNPLQLSIMGTLDNPVHASNLTEVVGLLESKYKDYTIIAIDACLGRVENVGTINVSPGPIKPGAGVNKILPVVGHISITGTVNMGGMMEYLVLQNTRLSLVMKMAEVIAEALFLATNSINGTVETKSVRINEMEPDYLLNPNHNPSSSFHTFPKHTGQSLQEEGNSEAAPGVSGGAHP